MILTVELYLYTLLWSMYNLLTLYSEAKGAKTSLIITLSFSKRYIGRHSTINVALPKLILLLTFFQVFLSQKYRMFASFSTYCVLLKLLTVAKFLSSWDVNLSLAFHMTRFHLVVKKPDKFWKKYFKSLVLKKHLISSYHKLNSSFCEHYWALKVPTFMILSY